MFSPFVSPRSLRPKTRETLKLRPYRHPGHFEKTTGSHRTRRARPSQVWTMSGRSLAVRSINQALFVRLLVFIFVLDLPFSVLVTPLI